MAPLPTATNHHNKAATNLLEREAVFGGDLLQEEGLALPIDDFALDLARELAVHKVELVGKDVVDAHLRLEPLREVGEAAGQNAHLIMYIFEFNRQ